MTTTSPPIARQGTAPATTAQLVLGAVLVAHLAVVEVAFLADGTGKNSVLTVAKFFGLHAATLMMTEAVASMHSEAAMKRMRTPSGYRRRHDRPSTYQQRTS